MKEIKKNVSRYAGLLAISLLLFVLSIASIGFDFYAIGAMCAASAAYLINQRVVMAQARGVVSFLMYVLPLWGLFYAGCLVRNDVFIPVVWRYVIAILCAGICLLTFLQRLSVRKTELPIVYWHNGEVEILPYLDLARAGDVWGIVSAGRLWKKCHDTADCFVSALNEEPQELGQVCDRFISVDVFKNVYAEKKAFNNTVKVLQKYDIEAETWIDGWYWSKDTQGAYDVYGFNLKTGEARSFSMRGGAVLLRLSVEK